MLVGGETDSPSACDRYQEPRNDPILIVSGALLATSVALFLAGVTPYPYGWIALSVMVALRLSHLSRKNGGRRGKFHA